MRSNLTSAENFSHRSTSGAAPERAAAGTCHPTGGIDFWL
jgi:hypothetical protein